MTALRAAPRFRQTIKVLGCLAALITTLVILSGLVPHSQEDIRRAVSGPAGYAAIGLFAFMEVGTFLGLVAPLELAVVLGGALAAGGELSLPLLMLVVWVSASLGDSLNFFVGRRLGRGFLVRHGRHLRITPERLARLERYFERHGPATVVLARFGPFVRTLTPFLAGSAGMPYARRFLPWSIVGCAAFAIVLSGVGFIFYRTLDRASGAVGAVGLVVLLALVILVLARAVGRRRLRAPNKSVRPVGIHRGEASAHRT